MTAAIWPFWIGDRYNLANVCLAVRPATGPFHKELSSGTRHMDAIPIDKQFAIYLLVAVGWTTLFSMTIKFPIRGNRNLGILACYILGIVMLIRLKFASALVTWCAFGILAGFTYNFYEIVSYARDNSPDKKLGLSLSYFLYGPVAWPIMIPEAIEYLLAELGVLRVQPTSPPSTTDSSSST